MFAEKFESLINKYPGEADAFNRLATFFQDFEATRGERYKDIKLDPNSLFDISQAGSSARLSRVITLLLQERVLERLLVIESPAGGGIAQFHSYAEVPSIVHDLHTDLDLEVTLDRIKTIYVPIS
jgi:hypothetical protein